MPEGVGYASTNVVAGTGLDLNYIGDHCFAYSGEFPTTTSAQTTLDFQTGNKYIIFDAYFTGPTQFSDPNTGREANWQVSLNGIVVATVHTDTSEGDVLTQPQLRFLAPPYTTVKIEVDGNDGASGYKNCVMLTGKLYK